MSRPPLASLIAVASFSTFTTPEMGGIEMTTATMSAVALTPAEALERKRLRAYKIFLYATIFNNVLLAVYTLGFEGGSMFAKVAAPGWAAPALGVFAVATVLSALLALRWKRVGVVGVAVCGAAAVVLALGVHLFTAASLFALGTVFWLLIARHQRERLS